MKILYPFDSPSIAPNPYVYTLIEGLKAIDNTISIDASILTFWNTNEYYDIVHIMWPDALLKGKNIKVHSARELYNRISFFKEKGAIIISTCHNLTPHYSNDSDYIEAYDVVYRNSAVILHLGDFSLNLFREKYANAKNCYVPHHVYDTIYKNIFSRDESLRKLGLSPKFKYILCFGMFRSDEERNIIISLSKKLRHQRVKILAPSFFYVTKRKNIFKDVKKWARYILFSLTYPNIKKNIGFIPNELLPFFCCSCDIALIQRKKILNSGNVPLNFYFGNVVVGPNMGNVGDILNKTGNPVFELDCNINDNIYKAVMYGLYLAEQSYGERNQEFAKKNLLTSIVCEKIYKIYLSTIIR